MSTLSSADEWLVRSIFFYNATPPVGAAVGLHFFEPRYRLLAVRALSEERQRQFVFLPNYSSYQAAHGDIGLLATITDYRPIGGSSTELPRADVELRFEARVLVLFHWVERETSGLHECLCVPIAEPKTPPSLACRFVSSLIWSVARPEPVGGGRGMRRYEVDPECAEGVGIFAEPSTSVPPLSTRLPAGAVVTVLDSAGEGLWFRHEAGWSKVEIALRPSWCLADELRRSHGIVVRHSSHNGYGVDAPNEVPDWHFLAYAPTAEGCELASSDLRDATPLSAALVFAMVVPDQSELVGVDSLITSLAAAYMTHRHGPPVADANAADADPMAMEELQEVLPKPSSVQADAVDPMVADVAQACNEVARSLRGMPVALVIEAQYAWELAHVLELPEDNSAMCMPAWESHDVPRRVLSTTALTLRHPRDVSGARGAMMLPMAAAVARSDAVATLRRYVRALNWPRVRLLFIGQAEGSDEACAAEGGAVGGAEGEVAGVSGEVPSCLFSLLDRELIWHIAQLLVDV